MSKKHGAKKRAARNQPAQNRPPSSSKPILTDIPLLFDANISYKLVDQMRKDGFPLAKSVAHLGMQNAKDDKIWQYAAEHAMTIVTRDVDFADFQAHYGAPPNVVRVGDGIGRMLEVEAALRELAKNGDLDRQFEDPETVYIEITRPRNNDGQPYGPIVVHHQVQSRPEGKPPPDFAEPPGPSKPKRKLVGGLEHA